MKNVIHWLVYLCYNVFRKNLYNETVRINFIKQQNVLHITTEQSSGNR